MADWNPTKPLPEQVADAFAEMYDWFEANHMHEPRKSAWMDAVAQRHDLDELAQSVRDTDWETPRALQERIDVANGQDDVAIALAVFACLFAIDKGFAALHLDQMAVSQLCRQYDETGHYNDASDGYVLPRRVGSYRGASLANQFASLTRANVDRRRVRLVRPRNQARELHAEPDPQVAIVPFLYGMEQKCVSFAPDTRFKGDDDGDRHYFSVVHLDGSGVDLQERIRQAVAAVRQQRVHVAIFPELALSHELLNVLKSALRDTAEEDSALTWVVAGHLEPKQDRPGDVPSDFFEYNSAVVLDQFGSVVGAKPGLDEPGWIQRKRHPYLLSVSEQEKSYGIVDIFDSAHDREEAISLGDQAIVLEEPTGRAAVMICEDFGQEEHTCAELRKMGCSLLIVILMDGPVVKGRWAPSKGRPFVEQTGTLVVIANSLVLPNLPKCLARGNELAADAVAPLPEKQTVGYLVEPVEEGTATPEPRYVQVPSIPTAAGSTLISDVVPLHASRDQ